MWSFIVGARGLFFLFIWASFMMVALPTDKAFIRSDARLASYLYQRHTHTLKEEAGLDCRLRSNRPGEKYAVDRLR